MCIRSHLLRLEDSIDTSTVRHWELRHIIKISHVVVRQESYTPTVLRETVAVTASENPGMFSYAVGWFYVSMIKWRNADKLFIW